jgi:hypothetical protein
MTEAEWREHQAKMRGMTAEEREGYRKLVHGRLMRRAAGEDVSVTEPADTPAPPSRSWWPFGLGRIGGQGRGRR